MANWKEVARQFFNDDEAFEIGEFFDTLFGEFPPPDDHPIEQLAAPFLSFVRDLDP